jgi:hypothetical protein
MSAGELVGALAGIGGYTVSQRRGLPSGREPVLRDAHRRRDEHHHGR